MGGAGIGRVIGSLQLRKEDGEEDVGETFTEDLLIRGLIFRYHEHRATAE